MLGGIYMDVHPTALIYHSSGMTKNPDNLLQLSHFSVFQLRRIHLDLVGAIVYGDLLPPDMMCSVDAGVVNKAPYFPFVVCDLPWVVGSGRTGMAGSRVKQGSHGFRGFLAGKTRHFDFTAEILVL